MESEEEIQKTLCISTEAILFLGTPHRGSDYADMGETVRRIVSISGFDTANQNIQALQVDGGLLEHCDERFQKLRKHCEFKIHTFQEAHGIRGTSFFGLNEKVGLNNSNPLSLEKSSIDQGLRLSATFRLLFHLSRVKSPSMTTTRLCANTPAKTTTAIAKWYASFEVLAARSRQCTKRKPWDERLIGFVKENNVSN